MDQTNKNDLIAAIQAAEAIIAKYKYNKIAMYYPDSGEYSRDKYPKQMDLMRAGTRHRYRALIGGNGSGKSLYLAIETYFHMSGKYPHWWEGHRFKTPINAWLCGREAKILREGLQEILFGGIGEDDFGTGIIPRDYLTDEKGFLQKWAMSGTANAVGMFRVKHFDRNGNFDGWSKCEFKQYSQGWAEFQGPTRQWIGFDEEPDDGKILAECGARLRGKDGQPPGHFLAAFTPTNGFRDVYAAFVPNGVFPVDGVNPENPSFYVQRIGWSDSPHLDEEWKTSQIAQWKLTDPNNIEARTEGYAAMGAGRVYPVDESFVVVPRIRIPEYWPKWFGLDPGAANFAVMWLCKDPNSGVTYVYDEYKVKRHVNYAIHADAIKSRGKWIAGGIDPHEAVKPRDTGETVQTYFESHGLSLVSAKGDSDATRIRIRAMLDSGALKIMDNCMGLLAEIRTYRYDSDHPDKVARNQDDHLCDAMAYAITVGEYVGKSFAQIEDEEYETKRNRDTQDLDSQRNPYTGY